MMEEEEIWACYFEKAKASIDIAWFWKRIRKEVLRRLGLILVESWMNFMFHLLLMDETNAFLIYKNYVRNRNKGRKWMSRTWMLTITCKSLNRSQRRVRTLVIIIVLNRTVTCEFILSRIVRRLVQLSCSLNVLFIMNSVHASHVFIFKLRCKPDQSKCKCWKV